MVSDSPNPTSAEIQAESLVVLGHCVGQKLTARRMRG